jgi:hypothetical protein
MTSDASRIAEHGPKNMGNGEVEREKKKKLFVMRCDIKEAKRRRRRKRE